MDLFIPRRQATISIFSPREDRKRSLREGANRLILIKEEEKERRKDQDTNRLIKSPKREEGINK